MTMCLKIKKYAKLRTAKEDIVVYKTLIHWNDKFVSSFQFSRVKIGETYTSVIKRDEFFSNQINEALHSFTNLDAAQCQAKKFNETLVKCIIPKGAKYYIGIFDVTGDESCASDTLTYVEILNY